MQWSPAFLEIMDTMGSGELIPSFVLFVSTAFALLSKLFISTQESFCSFTPPDSLLHSTGGVSKQLSGFKWAASYMHLRILGFFKEMVVKLSNTH